MTVKTHRKFANGSYLLEVALPNGEVRSFNWAAVPTDEKGKPLLAPSAYEKMQLAEAKALLLEEAEDGKKLKSEGKAL